MGFMVTMEAHLSLFGKTFSERSITEEGKPTMSVGGTINGLRSETE